MELDVASILLLIGVLIFAAHFFAWLFSFTKVPDVLLLIGVGLVLGPWLGVLTPDFFGEAGALFSIVVLAIMLFEGALDLRWDILKQSWGRALMLVFLNFAVTVLVIGSAVVWLTDLPPLLAFALAAILGDISAAVVIPLLESLQIGRQAKAVLLLESALSDVLTIVVTIALLAAYKLGEFNVGPVSLNILSSFLGASLAGAVGGFVWSILLSKVRQMRNSVFSTSAFVFVLFGLSELAGFSGPIAALVFGITIGNIVFFKIYLEKRHSFLQMLLHPVTLTDEERSFFNEVVFLLQTFFFVFVGLSITFGKSNVLVLGAIITLLIFAARIAVVRWSAPRETSSFDRSIMAVLVPKGLASAVLATLVVQSGVPGAQFIQETTYIVILFSIVLASVVMFLLYKTRVRRLYSWMLGGTDTIGTRQELPNLPE